MIAASESEAEALAHERTPLLFSSSPRISTETSTDDDSKNLKPLVPELGLPENDVACVKSGHGQGSSKGFGGVVAVMLLGSLRVLELWLFISSCHLSSASQKKCGNPIQLMIGLAIRCLHLECGQYYYPCHVGDHLLWARESWKPKLVGCVILLCHLRHPTCRMLFDESAISHPFPILDVWLKEIDPFGPNHLVWKTERYIWSQGSADRRLCVICHRDRLIVCYYILAYEEECWRPSSGVGRTLWEVVAARAICGMGGAGMHVIVSILIAGIYCVA